MNLTKIRYNPIWHRYKGFPLCLAITILSQFLSLLFVYLFLPLFPEGGLVSTMITSFKEDWYINSFYNEINNSKDAVVGDEDIVIIDIKDSYSSRKHIADVLRTISRQKPQIICLDFLFNANDSYDNNQSHYLFNTLKEIKDSTKIAVLSYKGNNEEIAQSFFMDSLSLENGLSDFYGYYHFIPYVSDSIPRISTKIAEMIGINVHSIPYSLVVNYRNKEFRRRVVRDSLDLDNSIKGLKDKIVLVGKYNDIEDVHDTPFLINGIKQLSGIEIIAYELSSLLSYSKNERKTELYPYVMIPVIWTFLFGFIVSLAYVFYLKMILNSSLDKIIIIFVKTLYLVVAELFIVFLCFAITEAYMIIPNILFFVTSVLFVDFLTELLNEIFSKHK